MHRKNINIIRVLGFTIVINAISIVQRVIFTREINFKLQTKVSLISLAVVPGGQDLSSKKPSTTEGLSFTPGGIGV